MNAIQNEHNYIRCLVYGPQSNVHGINRGFEWELLGIAILEGFHDHTQKKLLGVYGEIECFKPNSSD